MSLIEKVSSKALKKIINNIRSRAETKQTDISDHLETLFVESLDIKSRLIVELGVGDGEYYICSGTNRQFVGSKSSKCRYRRLSESIIV